MAGMAIVALPTAASAATAGVSGTTLSYNAASGEPNDLTVERRATAFRITDAGAPITPGTGCTRVTASQVSCPIDAIALLRINLGNLEDRAVVSGATPASMNGGSGDDELLGGSGADALDAGSGREERLTGRGGSDTLTVRATTGMSVLSGGDGNDQLTGAAVPPSSSYYYGPSFGGSGSSFDGGAGADRITGSGSNDFIDGGTGPDDIDGGAGGFDSAVYGSRTENLTVNAADTADTDGGASDTGTVAGVSRRDRLANIDGIYGGAGADTLTDGDADGVLLGGGGNDTLRASGGRDLLCGDGYAGTYYGGSGGGSPYLSASCYSQSGTGSTSDDLLDGGDGDDSLNGGQGADRMNGGAGFDAVAYGDRSTDVRATIDDSCSGTPCAVANDGAVDIDPSTTGNQGEGDTVGRDVESISGGYGADSISGSAGDNALFGGGGSDTIDGLGGDDRICGDTSSYYYGSPYGSTAMYCYESSNPAPGPGGTVTAADTINGGDGDDVLSGNEGPDRINGGLGVDTADYAQRGSYGGPGSTSADLVVTIADTTGCPSGATLCARANDGTKDIDMVTAGNQSEGDTVGLDVEDVAGGNGSDVISGSAAANLLTGGNGTDTLNGSTGNDVLEPGAGVGDVVSGGGGFDYASYRYAYSSYYGAGVVVDIDGIADDGPSGENDNIRTDVEGLMGSAGGDTLTGPTTTVANTLVGYGGTDTLIGNAGDDSLSGGQGYNDNLQGGAGNDLLSMADGSSDTGDCGDGTADRAVFDDVMDTLTGCETLQPVTLSRRAATGPSDPKAAAFAAVEAGLARHHRITRKPTRSQRRAMRHLARLEARARKLAPR